MKKTNIIVIVLMLMVSNICIVNTVRAEDIYGSNDEGTEMFDYDSEEEDASEDEDEELEQDEGITEVDKGADPVPSSGVILVEVFCGIIGVFMLFLALKANES